MFQFVNNQVRDYINNFRLQVFYKSLSFQNWNPFLYRKKKLSLQSI